MIEEALVLANGKGGVGKTSMSANVAGLAALSGWRTLLVDLDPQGNLGTDLGFAGTDVDDGGRGLFAAIVDSAELTVANVRPNLDVIPGGRFTSDVGALIERESRDDSEQLRLVEQALQHHIDSTPSGYHLVVIDTPPATNSLVESALTAARHLVIPTRSDAASLNGLELTGDRVSRVRRLTNSSLNVLGVALFGLGVNDSRINAEVRRQLEDDLGEHGPVVFNTFIRDSRKSGVDVRQMGLLAHEYEEAAAEAEPFWKQLRRVDRKEGRGPRPPTFSQSASGVAADYQQLTTEILTAMSAVDVAAAGVT